MKKLLLTLSLVLVSSALWAQCETTADFTLIPANGCSIPHTVFFTDQSNMPDTWLWDFGDGGTSTAQNPVHNFLSEGDFTVTLMVADTIYGCQFIHSETVSISILNADFSASTVFGCGPLAVDFMDNSTGNGLGEWAWDFGDGSVSNEQDPTHVYETPGVYDVTLTITSENGCTRTVNKTNYIEVVGPDVAFSANVFSGCDEQLVEFEDQSNSGASVTSWAWDFGDGGTADVQSPSYLFDETGAFDVSLTVTDMDGCSRTLTKGQLITIGASYDFEENVSICYGDSYTFPDGTVQDDITSSVNHTSNFITVDGCDSTIVTKVEVDEIDKSVTDIGWTLTANETGADYVWLNCDDDFQPVSGETNQSFDVQVNGDYAVEITKGACKDTSDCIEVFIASTENAQDMIELYPNPNNGSFNVFSLAGQPVDIQVFSLEGELVYESKKVANQHQIVLEQPAGVYIVELVGNGKNQRYKMLVE